MPHVVGITIKNYRALKNVTFNDLQPLTVVLGPNGCGKSTFFDVFGFLADCLQTNVRKALEPRGRFAEVRSREAKGPISFMIQYRESDFGAPSKERKAPTITYGLAIDERQGRPVVVEEYLQWRRGSQGKPFKFLDLKDGEGTVISGEKPEQTDERRPVKMDSPDILAIKALGQLSENPKVASLRRFIEGWFLSYFIPDQARQIPEAGVAEHLSRTGENLPNVVEYLSEQHPDVLQSILERITRRIPGLETVQADRTIDNRLVLRFKDGPFSDPFLARYVSDGTIKMFAYLILLNDPEPPPLLCIEEPENGLYPKLLDILAEELRAHARGRGKQPATQVFVSSHSPHFIDATYPQELWVMKRGAGGYTTVERADRIQGVPDLYKEGAKLGSLWYEDYLRDKEEGSAF
jgi:predicted ATPase